MAHNLLIIEDDLELNEIICRYLSTHGFECISANDGIEALRLAREHCPALIILDVQLPGLNGIEVCRSLRRETDAPILFLSGCIEEQDKIAGLEAGGDDYIAKPFSMAELAARVKAAIRRSGLPGVAAVRPQLLEFPDLTIDLSNSLVTFCGKNLELPPMEYQLLIRLARNPGRPFTAEMLFSLVWGARSIDTRTVAVHINRLRNKLGRGDHEYIQTVWGKGYKFNENL